jgi:hypothetical protein
MQQIMGPEGAQALGELTIRPRPIPGWLKPPLLEAGTDAWRVWSRTDLTRVSNEMVDLAGDDYRQRLRLNEKVIVIARSVDPHLYNLVKDRAAKVASSAGMAAAVQYAHQFIKAESFEYDDVDGKPTKRDGAQLWALLGTAVHSLGRDPQQLIEDIGEYMLFRLGRLKR